MPQLPISLSDTIIAKLRAIADKENSDKVHASTIAARIVRAYFEEVEE